jgi:CHAT domain-containing protein
MFVSNERLYLPQLPGAENESKAVSSIMHTTPLLGTEATKKTVVSRATTADVLYFATHGAAIPDDPLSGFLALAGAPEEAGRWSAKEIQSMDLSRTNLAVLSACQTGLGGVHPAGIIGVGRAFTLAGVRWVVMSLWNLDDKATSDLMQNFIRELAACKSSACLPAVALRRAMLTEKNLNPDPRVWGPFVVFGVPSGSRLKDPKVP